MERSEHGVVLQQVRQRLGIGKIVGRDEFDLRVIQPGADYISADAAEAVDSHFDCHAEISLGRCVVEPYSLAIQSFWSKRVSEIKVRKYCSSIGLLFSWEYLKFRREARRYDRQDGSHEHLPLVFTGVSTYSTDLQTVLTRAVSIAKLPLTALQNQDTTALQKKSLTSDLSNPLTNLGNAVAALGTIAEHKAVTAASSDSSKVAVTATSADSSATYRVSEITRWRARHRRRPSTGTPIPIKRLSQTIRICVWWWGPSTLISRSRRTTC